MECETFTKIAEIERKEVLLICVKYADVFLYTGSDASEILDIENSMHKIKVMPPVDYDTQLPEIYRHTKINLNITCRSITSGMPLRVLDIMGNGGFLLSNYQPELAEYFIPGEEVVLYESMSDMENKVKYYLSHDEERIAIAQKGCRKVREQFSYENKVRKMLKIEDYSSEKILFYQWYSFMNPGIEKAFKQLEIQYDILYYQQTDWEEDAIFEEKIEKQIQDNVYDAVFSVNFAPVISKVCQHRGIRYISCVYDSPMHIRNIEVMKNSCNEIYMFDWGQVQEYKKLGVNMEHLPLAVDSEIFNLPMNDEIIKKYSVQISLVGKMYTTDYPKYTSPLSTETKKLLNDMISSQRDVYNDCFISELLTDELLQKINAEYAKAGYR